MEARIQPVTLLQHLLAHVEVVDEQSGGHLTDQHYLSDARNSHCSNPAALQLGHTGQNNNKQKKQQIICYNSKDN